MVVHDFNGRLAFASPGALDRLQRESEDWVQQIEAGRPILPEQASY
jgi:hypothetical protein